MASFVEKVRLVVLGTAHDLLDRAIDMNSPSALRQYTRDLEEALERLRSEAAIQAAQVRTLEREKGDVQEKLIVREAAVSKLLNAGQRDAAKLKAAEIVNLRSRSEQLTTQVAAQGTVSNNLDQAVAKLEARHSDMLNRVRDLERLDRESKAKEHAADAVRAANRLVDGGADLSIDAIESHMRERNDVANEKFERAMGSASTVAEDADKAAAIDNILNELQPKAETTAK